MTLASRNTAHLCTISALLALLLALLTAPPVLAQDNVPKPLHATIVLVHGAFADGSSWSKVIPILQNQGLRVISVQNPLSSLGDDVAAVTRVLEAQTGPVILVGHSWGGSVISQAGNNSHVAALVYVAAFAPDVGESTNSVQAAYPLPAWVPRLISDSAGFVHLPDDAVSEYFAQDLPRAGSRLIAATQGPIRGTSFGELLTDAAWRTKPTWYLVASEDRMINPELERAFAAKMGATVTTLKTSHVPFLSMPRETAAVILAAAASLTGGSAH
jgi:pimeloyl-ACP methyl ester carboxylesterase